MHCCMGDCCVSNVVQYESFCPQMAAGRYVHKAFDTYICVHVFLSVCIICMCMCIYMCVYVCVCACVCVCVCVCVVCACV